MASGVTGFLSQEEEYIIIGVLALSTSAVLCMCLSRYYPKCTWINNCRKQKPDLEQETDSKPKLARKKTRVRPTAATKNSARAGAVATAETWRPAASVDLEAKEAATSLLTPTGEPAPAHVVVLQT